MWGEHPEIGTGRGHVSQVQPDLPLNRPLPRRSVVPVADGAVWRSRGAEQQEGLAGAGSCPSQGGSNAGGAVAGARTWPAGKRRRGRTGGGSCSRCSLGAGWERSQSGALRGGRPSRPRASRLAHGSLHGAEPQQQHSVVCGRRNCGMRAGGPATPFPTAVHYERGATDSATSKGTLP